MADNIAVTAGSGTTIAADDVGAGVLVQRVKNTFGVDGTATDVSATNPLPGTLSASSVLTTTLQSAAAATGNGTAQTVTGYAQATLNVTGTFVGTVTFEGSPDSGTTYVAVLAQQLGVTTTPATTTTGTGVFRISVDGLTNLRARVSAYTSGSITVTSNAVPLGVVNQIAAVTPATLIAGEDLANNILKTNTVFSTTGITTNTTTTVKTGAGLLHSFTLNNTALITVANLTVTVYDNTAASGTKIGTWTFPFGQTTAMPLSITLNCAFSTGLTFVTAGPTVTGDISVNWR